MEETGIDGGTTHKNPHWLIGFKHSEKTKKLISEASKTIKTNYICNICEKTGNIGHIHRYHKKCMENLNWKITQKL